MTKRDTQATWKYHDGTKHSPESVRRSRHVLDWDNMPRPFKVYVHLEPTPLSRDLNASIPALASIESSATRSTARSRRACRTSAPASSVIAAILAARWSRRAAACTGALYHRSLR
jgi:hypothetical protein